LTRWIESLDIPIPALFKSAKVPTPKKLKHERSAREVFDSLLEAKLLMEHGERRTTFSARTARWGATRQPRSRVAPARSLRIGFSKRTRAIPWQAYPRDTADSIYWCRQQITQIASA